MRGATPNPDPDRGPTGQRCQANDLRGGSIWNVKNGVSFCSIARRSSGRRGCQEDWWPFQDPSTGPCGFVLLAGQCAVTGGRQRCDTIFRPTGHTQAYRQIAEKPQTFLGWIWSNPFLRELRGEVQGAVIRQDQCLRPAIADPGLDHIDRSAAIAHHVAIRHRRLVDGDSGGPVLVALQIV